MITVWLQTIGHVMERKASACPRSLLRPSATSQSGLSSRRGSLIGSSKWCDRSPSRGDGHVARPSSTAQVQSGGNRGDTRRKAILVTGVLTDDSLAFGAASLARREGAEVALTGFGRGLSLTTRVARKLPAPVEVYELDVTESEQAEQVAKELEQRWGGARRRRARHRVRPASCLGNGVLPGRLAGRGDGPRGVGVLLEGPRGRLRPPARRRAGGGSIVGFDFDATVAWPGYDWMGVAKAALESLARYLARDLGPARHPGQSGRGRPGPDLAAKSIPGFEHFEEVWDGRAPLGWDVRDSEAVARACVALLSDWFPRDHRRDRPRRRRLPRHRRLTAGLASPIPARTAPSRNVTCSDNLTAASMSGRRGPAPAAEFEGASARRARHTGSPLPVAPRAQLRRPPRRRPHSAKGALGRRAARLARYRRGPRARHATSAAVHLAGRRFARSSAPRSPSRIAGSARRGGRPWRRAY